MDLQYVEYVEHEAAHLYPRTAQNYSLHREMLAEVHFFYLNLKEGKSQKRWNGN